MDGRTLAYTVLISAATGIVFGLAPAAHAARGNLSLALREGGRTGEGGARNRARNTLVVAEVAVSIVLLVGAALFMRSFLNLQRAETGFDTGAVTTVRFYMPGDSYAAEDAKLRRVQDILRRLEAVPGVIAAGASNLIPLDGGGAASRVQVPGKSFETGKEPRLFYAGVTAHYLQALGATLLRGRLFTEQEAETRATVAVVNVSMARSLLADAAAAASLPTVAPDRLAGAAELGALDPVGRQFRLLEDPSGATFTVIGVVADVMIEELSDREVTPTAFVPYAYQQTANTGLLVRATGDAVALTPAIRAAVRASDPALPVFAASSMDEIRRTGFWQYRLFGQMFGSFGALAVVLAIVGVYGVLSYSVSQRTQEFGVRMALGAEPRDVRRMMIGQGLRLAAWGIGLRRRRRVRHHARHRQPALQRHPHRSGELRRRDGADAGRGRRGGLPAGPARHAWSIRWWRSARSEIPTRTTDASSNQAGERRVISAARRSRSAMIASSRRLPTTRARLQAPSSMRSVALACRSAMTSFHGVT